MKRFNLFGLFLMLVAALAFSSCGNNDDDAPAPGDGGNGDGNGDALTLAGEVSGTLEAGEYLVTADIFVPEGAELRLMPGVILAFDGDGLSPDTSPELEVRGNLIADGTADNPIMFTVPSDRRDRSNAYEGFWGGIQCTPTCEALVLRHAIVEFTGGPARQSDAYDAGDPRYAIHFANPSGVFIFDHSTLRDIADDGIRPQGGARLAITNSVFYNVGETGGEGINIKDGTVGDVAYNLFYSVATNGSKPAGEGDGVPQTTVNTYNNTFVNCGFRRVQAGRGGSINYEQGARGAVYNNLIVNCRFGTRFRGDRLPDIANIPYGYTHYYANDAEDRDNFFPSTDVDEAGNRLTREQEGDIIQVDPMFVNYDVNTDKMQSHFGSIDDFKLRPDAPGVGAGFTGFSPAHSTLSAGGVTVTIPGPSDFIGAFGAN
ncbi:MAG: right-handed parallel beta-helix repeat-containing protein [Bernardetiaceae bacterium]|nr:right-handed parallel beta-helix repeat-containing protein [Bernardetiaceae bacterium]